MKEKSLLIIFSILYSVIITAAAGKSSCARTELINSFVKKVAELPSKISGLENDIKVLSDAIAQQEANIENIQNKPDEIAKFQEKITEDIESLKDLKDSLAWAKEDLDLACTTCEAEFRRHARTGR